MSHSPSCCVMQAEGRPSLLRGTDASHVGSVVEGSLMCSSPATVCCLCCFNIDEMAGSQLCVSRMLLLFLCEDRETA